jgi:hypothetical protein
MDLVITPKGGLLPVPLPQEVSKVTKPELAGASAGQPVADDSAAVPDREEAT